MAQTRGKSAKKKPYVAPSCKAYSFEHEHFLLAASPAVQPGGSSSGNIFIVPPAEDDDDTELEG